MELKEIRTIL